MSVLVRQLSNHVVHRILVAVAVIATILQPFVITQRPQSYTSNNGHCDAWFYYGLSVSPTLPFESEAYMASRIWMFGPTNLIMRTFPDAPAARVTAIVSLFAVALAVIFVVRRNLRAPWLAALVAACGVQWTPIVFGMSSHSYSGVTIALTIFAGGLLADLARETQSPRRTLVFLGLVAGVAYLTTLWLLPGIVLVLTIWLGTKVLRAQSRQWSLVPDVLGFFLGAFTSATVSWLIWRVANGRPTWDWGLLTSQVRFVLNETGSVTPDYRRGLWETVSTSFGVQMLLATIAISLAVSVVHKLSRRGNLGVEVPLALILASLVWMSLQVAGGTYSLAWDATAVGTITLFVSSLLLAIGRYDNERYISTSAFWTIALASVCAAVLNPWLGVPLIFLQRWNAAVAALALGLCIAVVVGWVLTSRQRLRHSQVSYFRSLVVIASSALLSFPLFYGSYAFVPQGTLTTKEHQDTVQEVLVALDQRLETTRIFLLGADDTRPDFRKFTYRALWGGIEGECKPPDPLSESLRALEAISSGKTDAVVALSSESARDFERLAWNLEGTAEELGDDAVIWIYTQKQ